MFKVNNKITRMLLMNLFWCLYCKHGDFVHFSLVHSSTLSLREMRP